MSLATVGNMSTVAASCVMEVERGGISEGREEGREERREEGREEGLGIKEKDDRVTSCVFPGVILPGHHAMAGSLIPPSHVVPLPHLNTPGLPPLLSWLRAGLEEEEGEGEVRGEGEVEGEEEGEGKQGEVGKIGRQGRESE